MFTYYYPVVLFLSLFQQTPAQFESTFYYKKKHFSLGEEWLNCSLCSVILFCNWNAKNQLSAQKQNLIKTGCKSDTYSL